MDWLLTNDRSGTSRGRQEWLKRLAAAGLAEAPRPLDDLGQIARLSADDRVIVAGGDGTVNLVARDCARSGCRLGVLPAGTGNDLARGLDIPLDPDAACETIVRGVARTLDLAAVNDRHFLNVAHVGFGSEVGRRAEMRKRRGWGRLSYPSAVLDKLQRRRGFKATIRCGGVTHRGRWLEIVVANGVSFGGGQRVFDVAQDDGAIDVIAIRPKPVWRLIWVWIKAQMLATTPSDDALVRMRGPHCEVDDCAPRRITADGEQAGEVPARFTIEHRVLRVIVPARASD
ncbi:MAG: YegS/Rv2252/BmrU family lipid kinase [Gammaproteobacteria bacterium]|nr:YegS/Rv2252/BmrU family lipid kinase [Gammaproteobacteria bacterium]